MICAYDDLYLIHAMYMVVVVITDLYLFGNGR